MNISLLLHKVAKENPDRVALYLPKKKSSKFFYETRTFKEVDEQSSSIALGLKNLGIKKGTKVLVFLKPSFEFPMVVFALLKLGAICVLIDPGMGVKKLLKCVKELQPEACVALELIHNLKHLFRSSFSSVKIWVSPKRPIFSPWTKTLESMLGLTGNFTPEILLTNDPSAIIFTSGATGSPKGVLYTHGIFATQIKLLQEQFAYCESDKDLPGFPLFSLFTMAMGVTSVIPVMNPTKPAKADPKVLFEHIKDHGITTLCGSPAIWRNLADYSLKHGITLPTVRAVILFGAPVPLDILANLQKILPNGTAYTPYGATECLPVSCVSSKEILENLKQEYQKGFGICIGKAFPSTRIEIIPRTDDPILNISDITFLKPYEVGEIVVLGDQVTPRYWNNDKATQLAKIKDDDRIWHRMGDLGFFDKSGNLWFCGRKVHAIELKNEIFYSVPMETIFNQHPNVKRSALVKILRDQKPRLAIVVERYDMKTDLGENKNIFKQELLELAKNNRLSLLIDDYFLHPGFPVDTRHNIKIDRQKLSEELTREPRNLI